MCVHEGSTPARSTGMNCTCIYVCVRVSVIVCVYECECVFLTCQIYRHARRHCAPPMVYVRQQICVCVCVCVCMRVYVHTCIHACICTSSARSTDMRARVCVCVCVCVCVRACICASPARSTDMRAGIVDLPVAFGPRKLRPDLGRLPIATMEGAESSAEGGVSVGPADKARTYAWTKVLNNKEWKLNCLCVPQRMVCFARGTESSAEGGVEYGAGGQGTQQWMNKVFNNGS